MRSTTLGGGDGYCMHLGRTSMVGFSRAEVHLLPDQSISDDILQVGET
jgi:hypothetical protein